MTAAAQQETAAYESVRRLVYDTAQKFHQKHPWIDWDDIESEANSAFLTAYRTWQEDTAKLTTWTKTKVQYALLELARNGPYRFGGSRIPLIVSRDDNEEEQEGLEAIQPKRFNMIEFKQKLSPDAAAIAELIVSSPPDLICKRRNARKTKRKALARWLMDLGWAAERIVESFREIKQLLLE